MPEPKRKPTILETLNERILILEGELFQANLLLDDLNVPSKTKTGRDMSVVGRLQWILSYTQGDIDAQVFRKMINDRNKPIIFSRN